MESQSKQNSIYYYNANSKRFINEVRKKNPDDRLWVHSEFHVHVAKESVINVTEYLNVLGATTSRSNNSTYFGITLSCNQPNEWKKWTKQRKSEKKYNPNRNFLISLCIGNVDTLLSITSYFWVDHCVGLLWDNNEKKPRLINGIGQITRMCIFIHTSSRFDRHHID